MTVSPIHRPTQVCSHEQFDVSPPQDPAQKLPSDIIKLMTRFLASPGGATFRTVIQTRIEQKQCQLPLTGTSFRTMIRTRIEQQQCRLILAGALN